MELSPLGQSRYSKARTRNVDVDVDVERIPSARHDVVAECSLANGRPWGHGAWKWQEFVDRNWMELTLCVRGGRSVVFRSSWLLGSLPEQLSYNVIYIYIYI